MGSDAPFLFDGMEIPTLSYTPIPVYTSPVEQATLDIMEEVDLFFRSSITVEEYDAIQKKVKKILTEAFCEKPVIPHHLVSLHD